MVNVLESTVVKARKNIPYSSDYIEASTWFPYADDENLPHEDIAIVLVTNGWNHYSPALVVDYNWVNQEKISKFFHCLDAAQQIYSEIDWTIESQKTQRE